MDKRLKLFYLVAVGWIFFMVVMTVIALHKINPPARKPTTQNTHTTPTDFKGQDYAEGLVTEYHEEPGYPLPLGVFTVVVDGVEYRVQEPYGSLPTPINPGYYQVINRSINVGIITVIISWQKEVDMVSGFITSERIVGNK
jgi:hypothetical protein